MSTIAGLSGTVSIIDGKPRLSGSFSGFDSAAIIEALVDVRRIPADRLETRIGENEVKITAFQELSSLLETLRQAADKLRNPPGSTGLLDNVFASKAAFLTSSDSSVAAGDILGVTAANGASAGTYEIVVNQIAKAHKLSGGAAQIGGAPATSASDPLGLTDTLTLGLRDGPLATDALGDTVDIAITSSMTLNDVATAINAETETTGVQASVLKVSNGDFRLVLTAAETNRRIDVTAGDPNTLTALGGLATDLQPPQGAELVIDGTTVYRDSNEISDLVDGLTFDLYKAAPADGTNPAPIIKVEIEHNIGAAKQAITDFVDAYNGLRDLIISQQTVDGENGAEETAVLFGDNLVRSLGMKLGSDLSNSVGLPDDVLSSLRAVGITMDASNKLTIDGSKLDALLVDNYDQLRAVFEFGFNSSSPDVRVLGRSGPLGVTEFTLHFTSANTAAGAATGVEVVGYGEVFDVVGNRLVGKDGTPFEGLDLAYSGEPGVTPADITVSMTNGVAERIYQTADSYTRPGDGQIPEQIGRLEDQSESWDAQITRIDEQLEIYRQTLIAKFTAMEQAMAAAEAMSKQFEAMLASKD